jgi:hypothetical protein
MARSTAARCSARYRARSPAAAGTPNSAALARATSTAGNWASSPRSLMLRSMRKTCWGLASPRRSRAARRIRIVPGRSDAPSRRQVPVQNRKVTAPRWTGNDAVGLMPGPARVRSRRRLSGQRLGPVPVGLVLTEAFRRDELEVAVREPGFPQRGDRDRMRPARSPTRRVVGYSTGTTPTSSASRLSASSCTAGKTPGRQRKARERQRGRPAGTSAEWSAEGASRHPIRRPGWHAPVFPGLTAREPVARPGRP